MTLVILTLGASPLAVVVAAHSLHKSMTSAGQSHSLVLLYSTQVKEYARQVRDLLGQLGVPLHPDPIVVAADDLDAIFQKISQRLRVTPGIGRIHLHYSGGSKTYTAHVVEAVQSIGVVLLRLEVDFSYLDPRTHRILQRPARLDLPWDERRNLKLTLPQLAKLHLYEGFSEKTHIVDAVKYRLGCDLTDFLLLQSWPGRFMEYESFFKEEEGRHYADFSPSSGHETWSALAARLRELFPPKDEKGKKFAQGLFFEFYAIEQLRGAMAALGHSAEAAHFDIKIWKMENGNRGRDFQLDLACILGYQTLAISCTVDRRAEMTKPKAFEVARRARQFSGSESRALLLCPMEDQDAAKVQHDARLEDTAVGDDLEQDHLQVWGIEKIRKLSEKFTSYLQDTLNWSGE